MWTDCLLFGTFLHLPFGRLYPLLFLLSITNTKLFLSFVDDDGCETSRGCQCEGCIYTYPSLKQLGLSNYAQCQPMKGSGSSHRALPYIERKLSRLRKKCNSSRRTYSVLHRFKSRKCHKCCSSMASALGQKI